MNNTRLSPDYDSHRDLPLPLIRGSLEELRACQAERAYQELVREAQNLKMGYGEDVTTGES